jgi:hypothetical protein
MPPVSNLLAFALASLAISPTRLARVKGVGGGMMIGLRGVLLVTSNKR